MSAVLASAASWQLTRAAGAVSLVLLTGTLLLGILNWSRFTAPSWPRALTTGVHRGISLLAVTFVAIHVATSVIDGYAPIALVDAVVPFVSAYRPLWLGLGALAFDLLLALVITSLLRRRLPPRAWRSVHWLSYACWPVALVHGLGTGTDARSAWLEAVAVACFAAVAGALAVRIARARTAEPGLRTWLAGAATAAAAFIVAWSAGGPLAGGWAARAGTPADLLASSTSRSDGLPSGSFELPLHGNAVSSDATDGSTRVQIDATLGSGVGRLELTVAGRRTDDGIVPSSIEVALGPAKDPERYTGSGRVSDGTVQADVSDGTSSRRVSVRLAVDDAGTASGTVVANAQT